MQEKYASQLKKKLAVVCDGTVVTKQLNAASHSIGTSDGTELFSWKECKFPAAANSCGTTWSILCIWNSIIRIHSFLSNGVCNNAPKSLCNTHTCILYEGEMKTHTVSRQSPLFSETQHASWDWEWREKGVSKQDPLEWIMWLLWVQIDVGKQKMKQLNWCNIVSWKCPKSMSPLWRT